MIITLTTDFGLRDSFVGTMKGVILGIAPTVKIVDLTHGIAAGDIRGGAFALMTAAPFFPAGTIHVAVVDPGVGSPRKAVAIRNRRAIFIGPDNGVLSWAVKDENPLEIRCVENPSFFLPQMSNTFHGRDLFAPTAAWLAANRGFSELGPELADFHRMNWPKPVRVQQGWKTEVVHVDIYGNSITAFPAAGVQGGQSVLLPGGMRIAFEPFYAAAPRGHALAIIGSSGFVEIAINQGDAASELSLRPGTEATIVQE
ncbi:MAG TPA: SAM-dependent chlorinase/fluorinase [Terrimicrobiaceae bacterium]